MTCEAMPPTTDPITSVDWTDDNDHTVGVDTLFDHNGASIRHLRGFTTEHECKLLMDNAAPRLRPATVAEEGNNQARSKHRRAQAANVDADWRNPGVCRLGICNMLARSFFPRLGPKMIGVR